MDEIYNISSIINGMSGSGAMGSFARSSNTILGGFYYGWFILFIVGLVLFIYMKTKGWTSLTSLTTAVFANMILGWFLFAMQLINAETVWILVLGLVVCIFALWLSNRGD
jgi:hypothetical protein